MTFEIHVPSSERHKNVAGLNRLLGFETSRLDNRKKIHATQTIYRGGFKGGGRDPPKIGKHMIFLA